MDTSESKREIVQEAFKNKQKTFIEIEKHYVETQEKNSTEVRDFIRLQLSLTPVMLGIVFTTGEESLKSSSWLQLGFILLTIYFVLGIIYLFIILNERPIQMSKDFATREVKHYREIGVLFNYLTGKDDVTYDQIRNQWKQSVDRLESSIENEKEDRITSIDPFMILLEFLFIIAIVIMCLSAQFTNN